MNEELAHKEFIANQYRIALDRLREAPEQPQPLQNIRINIVLQQLERTLGEIEIIKRQLQAVQAEILLGKRKREDNKYLKYKMKYLSLKKK
jgi:hypothetical protein